MWHRLIKLLLLEPRILLKRYKKNYNQQIRTKQFQAFIREVYPVKLQSITIPKNVREYHAAKAVKLREKLVKNYKPLRIEQDYLFPKPAHYPLFFEEVFVTD